MNRLGLFCVISLLLFVFSLSAQVNQDWLACYGNIGNDEATANCFDNLGNFYVAGTFKDTISIGSHTLNSGIHTMAFIAAYNSARQVLWATQSSSGGTISRAAKITGIIADEASNLYITGTFIGTLYIGGFSVISLGDEDIFVAKLNPAGVCQWLKRTGGGSHDYARGICLSNSGQPVIGAYIEGNINLWGTALSSLGDSDILIFKLDSAGALADYAQFGSSGQDRCYSICSLPNGGYAISGSYLGAITFGTTVLPELGQEAYVCKLDDDLTPLWALNTVGSALQDADAVCADSSYIYLFGNYANAFSLGTCSLPNVGSALYGARLDHAGNSQWLVKLGSSTNPNLNINSACINAESQLYLAGFCNADFLVPGLSYSPHGNNDAMLLKLTADGSPLWMEAYGGNETDNATKISINDSGMLLLTGSFASTAELAGSTVNSAGLKDAFSLLLREADASLPACPENLSLQKIGTTLRLSWNAVNLSQTGQSLSVSGYRIFYCADPNSNDYQLLGETNGTSYDLSGTDLMENVKFFRVTAYQ